jgi:A/G-specific adenine glycosylase
MLQQTRVETVIPYFERWMAELPTIESLARADEDRILNLWEGLGYYRRALNLKAAARIVVEEHSGQLPSNRRQLQSLPGIGTYTSAAIAAIAYDQDVIALDSNLRRVLARLFGLKFDAHSAAASRELEQLGLSLLPHGSAADFNQALMDLGAAICTARTPACADCPLRGDCLAYQRGTQERRPQRRSDPQRPLIQRQALAIIRDGHVLLGKRPPGKLLGGLWEFPGRDLEAKALRESSPAELAQTLVGVTIDDAELLGEYRHSYSHFQVHSVAFYASSEVGEPESSYHAELKWIEIRRLDSLPMGKVDRALARDLQSLKGDSTDPGR